MTASDPIVIVGAARTPLGGFLGDLKDLSAAALGATAIRAAVERAKAEFFPTVGVSGAYGEQMWGYRFDGTPSVKTAQPQYAGLVTIHWDIFTGFKRLNDVRQAEADRDAVASYLSRILGAALVGSAGK